MRRRLNEEESRVVASLKDKPIGYRPNLARISGSINAGLLLSQLIYWWDKRGKTDFVYKTVCEIENETCLSRSEQENAIEKLKSRGFIEVCRKGIPAKRHFKLIFVSIENALIALNQSNFQECRKDANCIPDILQSITESTQENTSKSTTSFSLTPSIRSDEPVGIVDGEKNSAQAVLTHFNTVFSSRRTLTNSLEKQINHWLAFYSEDELLRAIEAAYKDRWWRDKITPERLFNVHREEVSTFLQKAEPRSSSVYSQYEKRKNVS